MTTPAFSAFATAGIGVLDLCKRDPHTSPAEAMRHTMELAAACERLGYARYWLAEHHVANTSVSAPELLLALMAERTRRIRIGFGGVVLKYYSPYRVAEIASVLSALSGGRLDLGLCRGPGVTEARIAEELVSGNLWQLQDHLFDRRVGKTLGLVRAGNAEGAAVQVFPPAAVPAEPWILAASAASAAFALEAGASFAVPLFIMRDEERARAALAPFREATREAGDAPRRRTALAVSIVCASDEALARSQHARQQSEGSIPSNLVGTYAAVADQVRRLQDGLHVDDVLLVSFLRDHESRLETYSRLAECL
jgi:luciferase family oxidoreductase group 1